MLSELDKIGYVPRGAALIRRITRHLEQAFPKMQQVIADRTVDAAAYGRRKTLSELRKPMSPFPDRIQQTLRDSTFRASESTLRRMHGDVMSTIETAVSEGLGTVDVAERLKDDFDGMSDWQLRRIARTETNRAQQSAAFETEVEFGVEYHQWLSAADERTRESHVAQNRQIVRVGGQFSNGLTRPGDPSGPLHEIINCRCRLAPFFMPPGMQAPSTKSVIKSSRPFFESDLVPIDAGVVAATEPGSVDYGKKRVKKKWTEDALSHPDTPEPGVSRRIQADWDPKLQVVELEMNKASSIIRQVDNIPDDILDRGEDLTTETLKRITADGSVLQTQQSGVYAEVLKGYIDDPATITAAGNNPIVFRGKDGLLVAVDGHHRMVAAEHLGMDVTIDILQEL